MMGPYNRRITGSTTVAKLCDALSNLTARPVIDVTELKGTYDFDLSWTPDENERVSGEFGTGMAMARATAGAPPSGAGAASSDGKMAPDGANEPGPTLVQALLTNYGLKLEARKNPADILVVDRAEKVPTEN
jgi:uncharacterized protein (TIGR03435 family)